jgi:Uma2 family endonuclease
MVATKHRYTCADLLDLLPDNQRIYEILGGELAVFSSPDEPHAAAFDYATRGTGAEDVTHPDVFFVRADRGAILGQRCMEAAPDLIVEVLSPSTRADDLPGGRKWAIYERYGVAHYWIVDPEAHTVTQYVLRDGRYAIAAILRPGDRLASSLFPSITLDVADLFPRDR